MNAMSSSRAIYETGAATHTGRVRLENEDSLLVKQELGVWCVADGIGGHEDGKYASQTVVEHVATLGRAITPADLLSRLEDRLVKANDKIRDEAHERGVTMGSTVASLLIHGRFYAVAWSGDSRVYLVRGGEIRMVSSDHNEARELMDKGILTPEEARRWPRRNVITRAVGVHDDPNIEVVQGELAENDQFVLCSDGLTNHVSDADILFHLQGKGSQAACDMMVETTLARGATDNVTVVVVKLLAVPAANDKSTVFVPDARPRHG
jgi:serine/threonine protein phosphatase PrpC